MTITVPKAPQFTAVTEFHVYSIQLRFSCNRESSRRGGKTANYSCRSATMGLTFAARRAGM